MGHLAIIGGSGSWEDLAEGAVIIHDVTTPFGRPSAPIKEIQIQEKSFFFLPRHGEGHVLTPSEVNYRANIFALKQLGVKTVLSFSAVGSLKEEYAPTHFVLPDQFIDWTKGQRERTFFGKGMVGHVSTAYPVEKKLQDIIASAFEEVQLPYSKGGSYLCIEGPQFSSRAESLIYRSFGADVIGMTNVPESYLAKEAGMMYASICSVTDFDCWKEEHCSLEEIMKVLEINKRNVQKLIQVLIPKLLHKKIDFTPENTHSVVTNPKMLTDDHRKLLEVLLS